MNRVESITWMRSQKGLHRLVFLSLLIWGAFGFLGTRVCQADLIEYNVSLNISQLGTGSYGLDYFFINGGAPLSSDAAIGPFNVSGGVGTVTPNNQAIADNDSGIPASATLNQVSATQLNYQLNFDYTQDNDTFGFAIFDNTAGAYIENPSDPGSSPFLFTIDFSGPIPMVDINDGFAQNFNVQVTATPEPGTWAMMGLGLAFLAFTLKRKKNAALA